MGGLIFVIVVIALILWVLASCIRIVPQAYAIVVERLGAYKETWNTGIHFKTPFIDRVARRVNLKEQVVDFPPQPVITKDNVTMQIDTVVFFQITDPKLFTYGVENQHQDACISGCGNRSMGNQSQSCRTEEHHSSGCYSGSHGKTDESGT